MCKDFSNMLHTYDHSYIHSRDNINNSIINAMHIHIIFNESKPTYIENGFLRTDISTQFCLLFYFFHLTKRE